MPFSSWHQGKDYIEYIDPPLVQLPSRAVRARVCSMKPFMVSETRLGVKTCRVQLMWEPPSVIPVALMQGTSSWRKLAANWARALGPDGSELVRHWQGQECPLKAPAVDDQTSPPCTFGGLISRHCHIERQTFPATTQIWRRNTHLASEICVLRAHRPRSFHSEALLLAANGAPSAGPSCSRHKLLTKAVHLPSCQNAPNQLQLGPIQMPSCKCSWKDPARNPSKPALDNEAMAWMNVSKPLY